MRVRRDARGIEAEVVGVGAAPDREQDMRPGDLGLAGRAIDADGNLLPARLEADALGAEADGDALGFEDALHGLGYVLVLALDQARAFFHDRNVAAEAAVDLREFEADIAAAHDHQMSWHDVELQDARVGEDRNAVDAGHVRHRGAPAHVDENRGRPRAPHPRRAARARR